MYAAYNCAVILIIANQPVAQLMQCGGIVGSS